MTALTATTCPDWRRLAADRDDSSGNGAAEWTVALAHFDACPRCRPAALAADPLLVFRRLPVSELTADEERSEASSVLQAVTAMRTARRLESRRRFAGWRRWAAAAVLALVSLSVGRDKASLPSLNEIGEAAGSTPAAAPAAAAVEEPALPEIGAGFEDLNRRRGTRVYQYQTHNKNLSVVMIVGKSLDV